MGVVRKLVRQHTSRLVSIPTGILKVIQAPEHRDKVELVVRAVPDVPDHVELNLRWIHTNPGEDARDAKGHTGR